MKKTLTLPVAVGVAILGCVLAVSANVTTSKTIEDLKEERYKRMLAEEQLQKAKNDVTSLNTRLVETQNKIQGIEKILNQGRTEAQKLEQQLSAIQQEKATLMQQIETMKTAPQDMDMQEATANP